MYINAVCNIIKVIVNRELFKDFNVAKKFLKLKQITYCMLI